MVQLSEWRWNQVNAIRHCSPILVLSCPCPQFKKSIKNPFENSVNRQAKQSTAVEIKEDKFMFDGAVAVETRQRHCFSSWVEVIHGFSHDNETLLCCSTWRQSQSFTFIEAEGLILYYWLIEFRIWRNKTLARPPVLWNKFWNSCIGECFIYSRKLENINLFSLLMLTIPGKRFIKRGVFNFSQQYYDKVRLNWPHKVNPGQSTGCS